MIKVTPELNEATGVSTFKFECNSESDLSSLDLLRVAFLGDHPKRGRYENSNTLVIEAKVPETPLS
jgi:hypothetical protein